jgi:hypothetical protein
MRSLLFATGFLLITAAAGVVIGQRPDAFQGSRDHPAIQYSTRPVDTRVSRLNRDLETGKASLTFSKGSGYLASLLNALQLPVESQMLVFSETSAQATLIAPRNPRALYFNDDTAVGWVRGAEQLEIVAQDPHQGPIFYTLDQRAGDKPQFKRDDNTCLQCHLTWDTLAVPGLLTISTFPMSDDKNAYATGVVVDHRTSLADRWGGWYVTGKAVPSRHYGNAPVIRPEAELKKPQAPPKQIQSVEGMFDTAGFLTPYSDVAALMVMGHQTHMTNLLTRLGWEARVAAAPQALPQARQSAAKPTPADRVQEAVRDVVDYMLFVDEAPILKKIEGSSGFAEKFAAQGAKDAKGRSLRQFDLERRLFRYPCSYMIYSGLFDGLPAATKDAIYQRLWRVLSGQETGKAYAHLTLPDRQAIVEILRDTKKTLPAYFQAVTR